MSSVHSLSPYPSPDEREALLEERAGAAGAQLVTYGESVDGRPLRAARVPCRGGEPKGRVLCAANIHGIEWVGAFVALELLRRAAEPQGEIAALLHEAELWVAPCLNPDGYARTFAQRGEGKLKDLRTNSHGVDLNRNFPPPPGEEYGRFPGAGSPKREARTYRGEAPLSEPEARHLAALLDEVPFVASVSLHAYMGTLITPRLKNPAAYSAYDEVCRSFTDAQPHKRYRRFASRTFDMFTGELEDWQHHVHGTWAMCVEVFPVLESYRQHFRAPSLFWRFNPRDPRRWADNDIPGIVGFFRCALAKGPANERQALSSPKA